MSIKNRKRTISMQVSRVVYRVINNSTKISHLMHNVLKNTPQNVI